MYKYKDAMDYLAQGRNKENRPAPKQSNNTRIIFRDSHIAIRLHQTDIIEIQPNDSIRLYTGGWYTVTTKARINEYITPDFHVYQENKVWYVVPRDSNKQPFVEGIRLHPDGTIQYPDGSNPQQEIAEKKELHSQVNEYVKEYMEQLFAGKISAPSGGDCWLCLGMFGNGNGNEHMKSHIEESYFVPSLLKNAIDEYEVGNIIKARLWNLWDIPGFENFDTDTWDYVSQKQLSSSLKKFIRRELNI